MHFSWFFVATVLGCCCFLIAFTSPVNAKSIKRKFDGDFEFAEEDDSRTTKVSYKKRLIHDPNNELCRPLNCKKSEICLLEDTFTAICISKKELHKSRSIMVSKSRAVQRKIQTDTSVNVDDDDAFSDSEDDDEDQYDSKCQECPVSKPIFICGSDNRTYSSPCRLEYHNCIHHTYVHINCTSFCPCKYSDLRMHTKKLQLKREKSLLVKSKNSHDITFTPRYFNYDNHHYQYIKYSKKSKGLKALTYNDKYFTNIEGTKKKTSPIELKNIQKLSNIADCPLSSKPAMANRLLDWFSVVMSDSNHQHRNLKSRDNFPIGCQSEVQWMFGHLDTDSDGRISLLELYGLEHDQNEPCLKPFLDACDVDSDIFVNSIEWCRCFSKAERPCAAMRRRSSPEVVPNCDSKGYYKNTQCHWSLDLCWCVDQHGIEFAGTRVRGTKPNCDSIVNKLNNSGLKTNSVDLEDDEDLSKDLEGSADSPLDF